MIIRGHEVQMKGYKYQLGNNNQPLTLTIFSAPKYCDNYRNKGAVAIMNVSIPDIFRAKISSFNLLRR